MNDLLTYIDQIDQSVNDSELSVLESLGNVYTKSISILESYEGTDCSQFDIIQEGEVLDQAKGNPNESMIKRILLFIPRLIKAIFQKVFGKTKQTDQMVHKLTNTDAKPKSDITVELTFGPDESISEAVGLKSNAFKEFYETLPEQPNFNQNHMSKIDAVISEFQKVLETIKNKQKVKVVLKQNESVKDLVSKISNRWKGPSGLKYINQCLEDLNKTFTHYSETLGQTQDQLTVQYMNKFKTLTQILGNVAATFANIYDNEIKPIYLNIFGQETNQNDQKNNAQQNIGQNSNIPNDHFEGESFNQNRLIAWAGHYKDKNPEEYYVQYINDNTLLFTLRSPNGPVADMVININKVDKSLIPQKGQVVRGKFTQRK